MELKLIRKIFTEASTVSELYIDGKFVCHVLEDTDRGLTSEMSLDLIKRKKIYGKTAIPTGTYQIVVSYSNKFKKMLPLLLGVKGYLGIRMHPGNTATDTDGCILPGVYSDKTPDIVTSSVVSFNILFTRIMDAMKKEKVSITIQYPEA